MRPNLTNFASTTLAGGASVGVNMTASDTSFLLATGTGSLFPTVSSPPAMTTTVTFAPVPYTPEPFIVAIDQELVLVSARSGDTCTVAANGRGYMGTTAAPHTVGAPVVQSAVRDHLAQLAGTQADAFNIDVPPWMRGGFNTGTSTWDWWGKGTGPSPWDDEFEGPWGGQGNPWTVYPVPGNLPGGTGPSSLDVGSTYRSCMTFQRGYNDTQTYYVYRPFRLADGNSFTAQVKMSHSAIRWSYTELEASFRVTVQSNPASLNTGDQLRIDMGLRSAYLLLNDPVGGGSGTTRNLYYPYIKATRVDAGVFSDILYAPRSPEHRYRIVYGSPWGYMGAGEGPGYNDWAVTNKTMSFATSGWLGFSFYYSGPTGVNTTEQVVIDYVRVGH